MENKKTGHRTELTIESIKYHTHFPDDLFTQRSLETGREIELEFNRMDRICRTFSNHLGKP